jgi:hypothetical protein
MLIGEIKKDVPCPGQDWRNGPGKIGPLREKLSTMNVGESLTISVSDSDDLIKARDRISSCRTHVMKQKECKFKLRKTGSFEFTIWRIK